MGPVDSLVRPRQIDEKKVPKFEYLPVSPTFLRQTAHLFFFFLSLLGSLSSGSVSEAPVLVPLVPAPPSSSNF